ncbi:putative major facilitator superfamily transporter [Cladophialophora carrionii]|uniref:Putative major facilitator superfamily transporter n=1 Tax=Cladophialophora carrionii TaxID=86049 RepID=A0A1C1CJU6_9EURO|nr:putative major facilitator superfamily transporter [Cladophialophora carrionii]
MTTEETRPLLRDAEMAEDGSLKAARGNDIVDFDPTGDSENPRDWPKAYKWSIVALLALMAFTVTFTCISVVPVANHIIYDLDGTTSKSASVLLVTIWELGEAFGPLVLAPLSEAVGRYPVFNVANVLFISATVLAVLCRSTPLFIAARALTGLAVASNVLNPAIVGDMFIEEERGSAMSAIMLAPLLGGAVGPAIAGAIAESLGWRQVLWMAITLASACEVVFFTCFRETFKVAILNRRVARLTKETGNTALRTAFAANNPEADDKGSRKLLDAVLRPFVVFFDSGVLQAMSLFGSLEFAYFYVMSTTLPDILEGLYGLSPARTGSAFIAFSVGSVIAVIALNNLLDKIYIRLRDTHSLSNGKGQPEYRLPLAIVGAFTAPLVVALYGWAAQLRLPLPVLLINLGLLGSTMMLAFLPLMAYVVDAFKLYSASAMTALIVTRCLMGTFLPLGVDPLVKEFGYGWGFTALCGLSLCTAPIPVLIYRYGSQWRERSRYSEQEL